MDEKPTYEVLEQKVRELVRFNSELRRKKEPLKRELELLQAVMNGAKNSHLVYLDRDFNFVRVNTAYAAACGYKPEEMIGKNHFALYPHAENEAIFARVRDTGEAFEGHDKPFDYPDQPERGTTYWDWTLTPVKDETGQVLGLVFALFETTERKRAEDKLHRTTELLDSVRKAQSMYIVRSDSQQVLDSLLQLLVTMTESEFGFLEEVGLDADDAPYKQGFSLSDISWNRDSKESYSQMIAHNLKFQNLYNLSSLSANSQEPVIVNDARHDLRSGGLPPGYPPILSFMGLPVRFGGKQVGIIGVANRQGGYDKKMASFLEPYLNACAGIIHAFRQDAKEKKFVEDLRESEKRYRTVADYTYDWEYWIAPDGSLPYVSPSCDRITGYGREEFQQDPGLLIRIVHPDDRQKIADHLSGEPVSSAMEINQFDFRLITRDGKERWISHVCQPVFEHEGDFIGKRASNRDISRLKRAEMDKAEAEAQNLRLQKAEGLYRMAGAVAHHFSNLLMVISGNLELSMKDLPKGEGSIKNLVRAFKTTQKAIELTRLMQTYLGQLMGEKECMDLSEACQKTIPLLQSVLPETIFLEVDLPSPGPMVDVNTSQMLEILNQLIVNAGESMSGRQGSVYLGIKTVSGKYIPKTHRFPVDWYPDDIDYACIEIADSGCGIPEQDIENLFDPFFTSKFTGRGLGLPAVLGMLRYHQGAVTVLSKPGRGSIFHIFLPTSVPDQKYMS